MAEEPKRTTTHTEQVGLICAVWAKLELAVDSTTWLLAGLNHNVAIGACITAQFTSIHQKLRALIALSRLHGISEPTITKLNQFRGHVGDTAEKRNRAVHDAWVGIPKDDSIEMHQWNLGIGKDVDKMERPVPIEKLYDIISRIEDHDEEFRKIRIDLFAEFRALQGNQTE